ncbi:hypothetical protein [Actinomadura miaoliensis]|uniref:Cytochrome P450 n=1 Tax=Actinomadura miaoliensis TaxID=430685 RepID=A0ABP7UWU0_9ACTN
MSDDRAADDAVTLWQLRRMYPHWAFLYDARTSTWTALRERKEVIVRCGPTSLWFAVRAAQSRYRTP